MQALYDGSRAFFGREFALDAAGYGDEVGHITPL